MFNAMNLIVSLLSDRMKNPELQIVLEEVMTNTDSFEFASGVYLLCAKERRRSFNISLDILPAIRKVLVDRFRKKFIVKETSFFISEEPSNVLIRLWDLCVEDENKDHKECTCAEYVKNILEQNPKHVGKLLSCFDNRRFNPQKKEISLNVAEIGIYLDINELYNKIIKANKAVFTTEYEEELVENFIKNYEMGGQDEDSEAV